MTFETSTIQPDREHLHGATAAQMDMAKLRPMFSHLGTTPTLVEFNFSGVVSVSNSYLRATLVWCLLCGKAHAEGQTIATVSDPWSIRALPLYPVVRAGSREIIGEIDDLLKQRGLACLFVGEPSAPPFQNAAVVGQLDVFLLDTLRLLASNGPSVAVQLKELSNEKITVGGWSNRLAALHAHRLVTRSRDGKSWIYQTLAKEHSLWV